MSELTPNLKLFKYNTETDAKQPFSINDCMNANWDKIDASLGSLEICDIGMALYVDESKGKRRYLNGQIVDINVNTQAFLNRLLEIKNTNPDNFTTEENWQAEALLNIDGCVYKFVLNYSGADVVSVRLPKYPDYVEINAGGTLPVVGNGKSLGITDGTHNHTVAHDTVGSKDDDYGLTASTSALGSPVGSASKGYAEDMNKVLVGITTDPTKSGIETTLKQTKLKMRYFIQIATGAETEANIVNTLENVNGFTLLESKYSDKPLYNENWLLSNGQYNAKIVYPTAYEGLQVEYNSEIEAGTTVTLPSGISYTKRGLSVKLSTEEYTDYDFVLNTADETFRLPLKTNLASGKAVVGNGMTLGLMSSGEGRFGLYNASDANNSVASGIYGAPIGSPVTNSVSRPTASYGVTDDPTKSGIETSDSDLYLYFYVGDIDQNHGIVNMGRIGEQLADKVDTSNTQWATNACMPDYTAGVSFTAFTGSNDYICPKNGYIFAFVNNSTTSHITLKINNTSIGFANITFSGSYDQGTRTVPVNKNDIISFTRDSSSATCYPVFYPLKGEN